MRNISNHFKNEDSDGGSHKEESNIQSQPVGVRTAGSLLLTRTPERKFSYSYRTTENFSTLALAVKLNLPTPAV